MTSQGDKIFDAIKANYWDAFDFSTATLSNICRQLAFAEGGICWFYISHSCITKSNISSIFLWLIWFFIFDALQYFFSSIISFAAGCYFEYKNEHGKLKNIKNVERTHKMNAPSHILFLIKLVPLSYSSYLLIEILTSTS